MVQSRWEAPADVEGPQAAGEQPKFLSQAPHVLHLIDKMNKTGWRLIQAGNMRCGKANPYQNVGRYKQMHKKQYKPFFFLDL